MNRENSYVHCKIKNKTSGFSSYNKKVPNSYS